MTRAIRRFSAARFAFQLAILAPVGSAIFGGCSSGVKTVPGDCPTGGTGALGGGSAVNGGASSGAPANMAGEGGQPQAGEGGAAGGEGGEGGRETVSSHGGASGGHAGAGTGGHGGISGGANTSGGHGGVGGSSASGGSSGAKALCGDKAVTPPEFCDDGKNTDLSYGCYACTTLPPATAPQGAQQCDACLQQTPTKACFACQDHRDCYACLRRQPSSFDSTTFCSTANDDDVVGDPGIPRQLSDKCFNPKDPTGSGQIGGPAGSATRGSVCQALLACALRTGCATGRAADGTPRTPNGFSGCYCGDGRNCLTQTAAGPCVQEVRAAAAVPPGLSPAAETAYIGANFTDVNDPPPPWVMLGVVSSLLRCANDGCASACYPSSTGSGGSGGSAGHGGGP